MSAAIAIAIASDHRGFAMKRVLVEFLKSRGVQVEDLGTHSDDSVDYPDFALKVAQAVARGEVKRGIVICHSGVGMSISANKVKGVRAALCHSAEQAQLARKHTDANVLALPAGYVRAELAKEIVSKWLDSDFEGGRHGRRIDKIKSYEEGKDANQ